MVKVFDRLPVLKSCCRLIPNLATATCIIAVLGIVCSPTVAWLMVRHSYVIRIKCSIASEHTKPDVVDLNFKNIISFGFGSHGAGLWEPCVLKADTSTTTKIPPGLREGEQPLSASNIGRGTSLYASRIKYITWIMLLIDMFFVACSVAIIVTMYRPFNQKKLIIVYIIGGLVYLTMSFIHAILYAIACMFAGGVFPLCELFLTTFDIGLWLYFFLVVNSYRMRYAIWESRASTLIDTSDAAARHNQPSTTAARVDSNRDERKAITDKGFSDSPPRAHNSKTPPQPRDQSDINAIPNTRKPNKDDRPHNSDKISIWDRMLLGFAQPKEARKSKRNNPTTLSLSKQNKGSR